VRDTIDWMTPAPSSPVAVAYFWGDDDLASSRAVRRMAEAIAATHGGPVERFEVRGDRNQAGNQIAELHQRVATQSMFGGGSLAVVTNAGALTVRNEDRDALIAVLGLVAPGSGVVFVEASQSGAREPSQKRLVDAVRAAGGEIRAFKAPKAGELAGWIEAEARERGLKLGQGASRTLASRVGGFVTDNDADRRNQTMIVDRELDKLALYRPDGAVTTDDVEALVAEAVPGSVWAFTDAVGRRDLARASELLERLTESTPEPVLLAVLHRRIRELLEVADRLASGEKEASLPRALGIHSYRAEQLAVQARRWTVPELEAAIEGLVDLDATVKNAPGYGASDAQRRLAFTMWLAEYVGREVGVAVGG
jgi:DNA polymerase-3 subunit delta